MAQVPSPPNATAVFCIDFEACNRDTWIAVAAGVFLYPAGACVSRFTASVTRPWDSYDASRQQFWTRHADAHAVIRQEALPESEAPRLERELVDMMRRAHAAYPNLEIVSDHPAFDLALLNRLCLAHGQLPCEQRTPDPNNWVHPVCTHSQLRLWQDWTGLRELPRLYPGRPVEQLLQRRRHLPWADVCRTVVHFMRLRDLLPPPPRR